MGIGRAADEPAALGRTRCRKFLSQFQISETKTIGALTERQRRTARRPARSCAPLEELQHSSSRERQLVELRRPGRSRTTIPAPAWCAGRLRSVVPRSRGLDLDPDRHRAGAGEQEEPDHEAASVIPALTTSTPSSTKWPGSSRPAGAAVGPVDVAELRSTAASTAIVATTPINIAPSAAPSDEVAPWICEPTHSHSSGVPIHSTRLPMNMISDDQRRASCQSCSKSRIRCSGYWRVVTGQGRDQLYGPRREPRPPANGQPEESLTCHQPISMPIRPRRGRTSQTPQPGSPRSLHGDRARSGAAGLEQHLLEREPAGRLCVGALGDRARAAPERARSARRGRARARPGPSRRGLPARAGSGACSRPPIGKAVTNASASSRSSRAICARSVRRAARSPPSTTVTRKSVPGPCGSLRDLFEQLHHSPPIRERRQLTTGLPPACAARSSAGRAGPRRTPTAPPRRGSPGTPSTPTENSATRCVRAVARVPGRDSPNSSAWMQRASATTSRPGGTPCSLLAAAEPLAVDRACGSRGRPDRPRSASSAQTGTPVSISATRSASSSAPCERKPPWSSRDDRGLLAGDPVDVGVEPDLAEERAVGVRDRLGAHRDHAGAAVAVGEVLEPR